MKKKPVLAVLVVFVVFWLLTDPSGLAHASESAGSQVMVLAGDLFDALIDFLDELGK